jgi:hypothetical protein
MQPVSKQRIGKYASTTILLLLETAFSIRSMQCGCKEDNQFSWELAVELSSASEAEKRWGCS